MKLRKILLAAMTMILMGGVCGCAAPSPEPDSPKKLWNVILELAGKDSNGVTEHPDDSGGEEIGMLDGNYTYVDNNALLQVIAGEWVSADGCWTLTLDEDCGMLLTLNGEAVLEDTVSFTYLQPGFVGETEFSLQTETLTCDDGSSLGEVRFFCHQADKKGGSGRLQLDINGADGRDETLVFTKTAP